ncbi:hypothetical protein Hdeb2414_s0020g00561021 [Helianthus debilis subsp. tardiflorus]
MIPRFPFCKQITNRFPYITSLLKTLKAEPFTTQPSQLTLIISIPSLHLLTNRDPHHRSLHPRTYLLNKQTSTTRNFVESCNLQQDKRRRNLYHTT